MLCNLKKRIRIEVSPIETHGKRAVKVVTIRLTGDSGKASIFEVLLNGNSAELISAVCALSVLANGQTAVVLRGVR